MPDHPRNIGASVRQRLLNLARARSQHMDLLLTRYALERLLYRLSLSPYREPFVLKGTMLLVTWFDEAHRATRDVDLLGFGDAAEDALLATFREIMAIEVDDGVVFDLDGQLPVDNNWIKNQIRPIASSLSDLIRQAAGASRQWPPAFLHSCRRRAALMVSIV